MFFFILKTDFLKNNKNYKVLRNLNLLTSCSSLKLVGIDSHLIFVMINKINIY